MPSSFGCYNDKTGEKTHDTDEQSTKTSFAIITLNTNTVVAARCKRFLKKSNNFAVEDETRRSRTWANPDTTAAIAHTDNNLLLNCFKRQLALNLSLADYKKAPAHSITRRSGRLRRLAQQQRVTAATKSAANCATSGLRPQSSSYSSSQTRLERRLRKFN